MAWNPNFKKGVDLPVWDWLNYYQQGPSYHGAAQAYDGERYLYYVVQTSSTGTTAGTTTLWRYDTWTETWIYMATTTSGNRGLDVEYDANRNVLYIAIGVGGTAWQVFNLNNTAVTIANVSCAPWALTTMAPVLPAGADYGASFTMPDGASIDSDAPANSSQPMVEVTTGAGSTTTSLVDERARMASGFIGLYARFTSGALSGQRRLITAVPSENSITTAAFTAAPATGDTFVIEVPEGTATGGTTSTLTMTGAGWTVNQYRDSDVIILSGTGAGQRRRIASNTADTLTLNAAVTGNARTGNFATAPVSGSVFRIVPSSDFLYFMQGTTLYRLDVVQTTGAAWSANLASAPAAVAGGGNTFHPGHYDPFGLIALRGSGTATVYHYDLGLRTWTTLPTRWGSETINTGASSAMIHGHRKIFIQKEASVRCYFYDIPTGQLEGAGMMPFTNPSTYEGKRAKFVITPDGVKWIYIMRAGGQEFFRVALEWLD